MRGQLPHPFETTDLTVDALHIIGPERIWGASSVSEMALHFDGISGDRHHGSTRTLKAYESPQLAGMEVANDRQLSIVDTQDMLAIAEGLELPVAEIEDVTERSVAHFMAGQLASNVMLGSPTKRSLNAAVGVGSVLVFGEFAPEKETAATRITGYNPPCSKPMKRLAISLGELGLPMPLRELNARFKELARARRGWVGSVHATGIVTIGQTIAIHAPLDNPESK